LRPIFDTFLTNPLVDLGVFGDAGAEPIQAEPIRIGAEPDLTRPLPKLNTRAWLNGSPRAFPALLILTASL
jgi:hypothetical protein